jgi:HSP20 family protein
VEAELPGMSEKDIEVKLDGNVLSISSKKKEEKEEKREGYLRRERRSAAIHRSFSLPTDVKKEAIDAEFNNGLLTIDLPKTEASKPRTIDVKSKEK